ncbi:hypothetical protein EUGRSUZ_F00333 [Eucalyptus grandis]|uniref:Uncharacterized protein n=2 Tax=Eucalyptus grandis TaxID=71139 RepID=A0ACC3KCW3_EUCGR|nr:hypothetical protein EUGRSUZ_F00333 [Eucalyptus grandis]
MLGQAELLLELDDMVYRRPLLQRQAQELVQHADPVFLRLQSPQIQTRPVRVRRNERQRVQQIKLPRVVGVQIQIPVMLHGESKGLLRPIFIGHELPLDLAHRQMRVPIHELEHSPPIVIRNHPKVVRILQSPIPEILRNPEQGPAVMNLTQRDSLVGGHHEQLPHLADPVRLHRVRDPPLLLEQLLHEGREPEPHLAVGVAVRLEQERVALEGADDLASPGEAELAVELAGVVEAEDALRLPGEEGAAPGEEAEAGVAGDEGLEGGEALIKNPKLIYLTSKNLKLINL